MYWGVEGGGCCPCVQQEPTVAAQTLTPSTHLSIWLNTCVGERNYRWFLSFLLLNTVLMCYGVWAAGAVLAHEIVSEGLLRATFHSGGGAPPVEATWSIVAQYLLGTKSEVVMVGALCTVMGAVVAAFTAYHAALAAYNITTNETFKRRDLEDYHADAVAVWRRALSRQTKAAEALAAAKVSGDAASIAAATARVAEAARPPFDTGAGDGAEPRPAYVLREPAPVPAHAYDKGAVRNLLEVVFPPSLWHRSGAPSNPSAAAQKGD